MRHKYETRGIVLYRAPVGESSSFVTLLTPELGLVRALAQSVRRSGAKLAPSLATFAESDLVLVRGREGWRVTGAILEESWLKKIKEPSLRRSASRISGLLLRLVAGETNNPGLFPVLKGYLEALASVSVEDGKTAEILAAIRVLSVLGLDAGEIPGEKSSFATSFLHVISSNRTSYINRINRGIEASGL